MRSWNNRLFEIVILCCLVAESTLIDLKHLLVEAKQKIPPVLAALESQNDDYLELGGKTIVSCSSLFDNHS